MYLGFVDLKGAFDRVDKSILWKELERIGIDEVLINAVRGLYRETKVEV